MWCFSIAVVMALAWGILQVQTLQHQIVALSNQKPIVIRGIDGQNGLQGMPGLSFMGTPGKNATLEQIAQVVFVWAKANPTTPQKGDKGEKGDTGRTLETRVDPETCTLQSKYTDDTFWNTIAQLPTPCTKEAPK